MRVSIITTAFNSADTIEKTLLSLVGQTYPDIECVISDGGSSDGTLEIVDEYLGQNVPSSSADLNKKQLPGGDGGTAERRERLRKEMISGSRRFSVSASSPPSIVFSEPDGGIYDAMNKGVAQATGDIVGILNSDDFYAHERVIARVVERFEATDCDALYADCCYVDRKEASRVTRYWKAGEYRKGAFRFGWMPPHPTFFVRRKHYCRLGSYHAEFKNSADYELLLRFIHKHELSLEYLPEVTVMMRAGGASNASLKNRLRANCEDREAWRINGLRMPFYTRYLKPLRKVGQLWKKQGNKERKG